MKLIKCLLVLAFSAAAIADDQKEETPAPLVLPDLSAMVATLPADDIGLLARVHFATATKDFDKAREFYRMIGYGSSQGGFPLTNTHQMARALGMFVVCQYELVKGEVLSLDNSLNNANIDLLQWKTPFDDAPPYELPNHLGMAYAAFLTTDLASDMAFLKSKGIEFLSEKPYGIPGDQFAFFRDPEGNLYKLVEAAPPHGDPAKDMHLVAMPYIGVNVSNFDESLEFYKKLGYTNVKPLPTTDTIEEARAYGLDKPFRIKGADISLARGDNHRLRLIQWIEPFDSDPAYPPPINRIGINRIALPVAHLDRAVDILKDEGVEFLSDIAPCCSGTGEDEFGIVHVIDPDGVFLELIGTIAKRKAKPQPSHCPKLEIKMPS